MNTNDRKDFTSVYRRYRLAIYRYTLARIGHVEDAQDITAQVFLKAYQKLDSYRGDSSIIYWLVGIARHQIIDFYRNNSNAVSFALVEEIPGPSLPLDELLDQEQRLKRVALALESLSEDRREALSLRLFAGLTNPEIAEIMGKSIDAVAMLVHRGIQDLKSRLGDKEIS